MDSVNKHLPIALGAALATAGLAYSVSKLSARSPAAEPQQQPQRDTLSDNVLIGDVGGTNVRLQVLKLYHHPDDAHRNEILKEIKKYKTQDSESLEECILNYLSDVPKSNQPRIGCLGIAGPVSKNKVSLTNIPHWPDICGESLSKKLGLVSLILLNDFTAAGYGVATLKASDSIILGSSGEAKNYDGDNCVKVVIGPGTGLGQGLLVRTKKDSDFESFPTEGGHVEYSVKNEEDFKLLNFARKFIGESNNIENLRAKAVIGRISVERLCAGPAVPLIYAFMKEQYPDIEDVIGKNKEFDQIQSYDVISNAMDKNDPLCLKVVEKFAEIFGTETGNLAVKTLPSGGIYLIGGVTAGMKKYLIENDTFMNAFYDKGRLADYMRTFPVHLVNPDIEVGLLGAQEKARREIKLHAHVVTH